MEKTQQHPCWQEPYSSTQTSSNTRWPEAIVCEQISIPRHQRKQPESTSGFLTYEVRGWVGFVVGTGYATSKTPWVPSGKLCKSFPQRKPYVLSFWKWQIMSNPSFSHKINSSENTYKYVTPAEKLNVPRKENPHTKKSLLLIKRTHIFPKPCYWWKSSLKEVVMSSCKKKFQNHLPWLQYKLEAAHMPTHKDVCIRQDYLVAGNRTGSWLTQIIIINNNKIDSGI